MIVQTRVSRLKILLYQIYISFHFDRQITIHDHSWARNGARRLYKGFRFPWNGFWNWLTSNNNRNTSIWAAIVCLTQCVWTHKKIHIFLHVIRSNHRLNRFIAIISSVIEIINWRFILFFFFSKIKKKIKIRPKISWKKNRQPVQKNAPNFVVSSACAAPHL